jgi:RHS repeat-associated protein
MRQIARISGFLQPISTKISAAQSQIQGDAMTIRSVLLATLVAIWALAAPAQTCPAGANWCSGLYQYDGMGNIRAIGSDTYIYDTVGRLVSGTAEVQRGGTSRQEYAYDLFGNRTSATRIAGSVDCLGGCEQSPGIDPATNHIIDHGAQYDDAGNLISITNTVGTTSFTSTYDYDAAGSMSRATAGSDIRQFIYTADDERIATRSGQSWTWTVRGPDNKVLREFTSTEPNNSSGLPTTIRQWAKDYVWRDGLLLASVVPTTPGASTTITQHYHLDHLGTPRVISNDAGVQTSIHAYYPFGAELNLGSEPPPGELMKFTGHERDVLASNPNTLDYMHARFEMGTMGRFLAVDPGKDWDPAQPQSWNLYSYVRNNPINKTDPTGRCGVLSGWFTTCQQIAGLVVEEAINSARNSGIGNIFEGVRTGDLQRAKLGQVQLDHEILTAILVTSIAPSEESATVSTTEQGEAGVPAAGQVAARELPKDAQKGIRTLETRIAQHEKKLADFKANPTVRQGMEGQSASVIKAQQQTRIRHLETEIRTFKENIERLKKEQ